MAGTGDSFRFEGFQSPKYTQVPDELFDRTLSVLSGAELKVLFYIIRRAFGFKHDQTRASSRSRIGRLRAEIAALRMATTDTAPRVLTPPALRRAGWQI